MIENQSFQKFFHMISDTDNKKISDIAAVVQRAITELAEEAKLGRLALDQNTVLYSSEDGYNVNVCVEQKYQGMDDAIVRIVCWPVARSTWTEAEAEQIRFLQEMILVVGERAKLLNRIRQAENTDKITGIANAPGIGEFGRSLLKENDRNNFGLFFINLKNFKLINKRYGQRGGDIVLKQFAEFLKSFCTDPGENAARLGGDNFILLVGTQKVDSVAKVLQQFQASMYEGGQQIKVPISGKIGFLRTLREGSFDDSITKCSVAMAFARRSSEDIVAFEDSMMEKMMHEKGVSEKFAKALENREFVVFYQPKVDVNTQEICGAEALVRWISQGDVIPPATFIPVLEREGSICKLDFYMLESVCKHIKQWQRQNIQPVRISVNFSKQHLKNPETVQNIIRLVQENEVPPEYLEVELTEMSDFEDFVTMKQFVAQLREAGIAVSIDDFGTGYSSLTLLRDLPIDTVKLDRSFVVNLESGNEKDHIMIQACVNMIKAFGMEVLVEGVETKDQYSYLKSIGCEVIQGFLFDKPMPLTVFNNKLTRFRSYGELFAQ